MSGISQRQVEAIAELTKRNCESLRIFRGFPNQMPFFRCTAREILARGGNRSSKSTIAAVRFAAIATNRPVYSPEGEPVEMRLPWQKDRELLMWCIGLGEDHIGQTLYRLLFRPGLFKIIRDEKTGAWRTYRPWTDKERSAEVKPSPPLIPQRFIASKAWSNKGGNVFSTIRTHDPTTKEPLATIHAFSSGGDVKAGDPVDEIWVDERIKYPSYYAEWQARLIDKRGRLTWSSWPDISNDALVSMTRRAEDEQEDPKAVAREFKFRMSDNPYLEKEAKEEALKGWSEEERRARDDGEYITDTLKMYPKFGRITHQAIPDDPSNDDDLAKVLRRTDGEPPQDWTRELILDPGTSHPGILLCAIPPPTLGDYLVPYREIYIPRLDADDLAKNVRMHTEGYMFERFIIDPNAGRQTPMGFSVTIQRNYARAFAEQRLSCLQSGSSFSPGSNDVAGRVLMLQSLMTIGPNGFPKLRIVTKNCPNLSVQLERCLKKSIGTVVEEFKHSPRQKIDLVHCLEYWVSRSPEWKSRPKQVQSTSYMQRLYLKLSKEHGSKRKGRDGSLTLGPVQVN